MSSARSCRPLTVGGLLLSTVLLFVSSCANRAPEPPAGPEEDSSARPNWLVDFPVDPEYPAERYFAELGSHPLSTGETEAREQAANKARSALARSIRTQIVSKLESYERSFGRSDSSGTNTLDLVRLEERIVAETDATLTGTRVAHSWRDEEAGEYWIKMVLDRERATNRFLTEIDREFAELPSLPEESADFAVRVRRLLEIHRELQVVVRHVATAEIVAPRNSPATRALAQRRASVLELVGDVTRTIEALSGGVRIETVSGSGQKVPPGGRLSAPIVFRVRRNEAPVVSFPVRFEVTGGGKAAIRVETPVTTSDGTVRCTVAGLEAVRSSSGEVVFPRAIGLRLDYRSISPEIPATFEPKAEATLSWPSLAGSRIGVAVVEVLHGETVGQGVVVGALQELVRDWGGEPVLVEGENSERLRDGSTAMYEQARRLGLSFVLRGEVRAEARPFDRAHFSYAGGRIELVDVEAGRSVAAAQIGFDGTARGADVAESRRAGGKALEDLAGKIETRLAGELSRRFAPPAASR